MRSRLRLRYTSCGITYELGFVVQATKEWAVLWTAHSFLVELEGIEAGRPAGNVFLFGFICRIIVFQSFVYTDAGAFFWGFNRVLPVCKKTLFSVFSGGAGGDRTLDFHTASVALSRWVTAPGREYYFSLAACCCQERHLCLMLKYIVVNFQIYLNKFYFAQICKYSIRSLVRNQIGHT